MAAGQLTIYWSLPVAAPAPDKPLDLETMHRDAREIWPEAAATIAQADDFSRATYRNVALPRWKEGRVLFIGDAAHGTSPQLGQGANLALLDAWTLADTLATGGDLADFARRRSATVRFYRQAYGSVSTDLQVITMYYGIQLLEVRFTGTPRGHERRDFADFERRFQSDCRVPKWQAR